MAEGGRILEAALELVRCADCRTGPAREAVAKGKVRALAPQPYAEAAPHRGAASAYGDHEGAEGASPGRALGPFVRKPEDDRRGSPRWSSSGYEALPSSVGRSGRATRARSARYSANAAKPKPATAFRTRRDMRPRLRDAVALDQTCPADTRSASAHTFGYPPGV